MIQDSQGKKRKLAGRDAILIHEAAGQVAAEDRAEIFIGDLDVFTGKESAAGIIAKTIKTESRIIVKDNHLSWCSPAPKSYPAQPSPTTAPAAHPPAPTGAAPHSPTAPSPAVPRRAW